MDGPSALRHSSTFVCEYGSGALSPWFERAILVIFSPSPPIVRGASHAVSFIHSFVHPILLRRHFTPLRNLSPTQQFASYLSFPPQIPISGSPHPPLSSEIIPTHLSLPWSACNHLSPSRSPPPPSLLVFCFVIHCSPINLGGMKLRCNNGKHGQDKGGELISFSIGGGEKRRKTKESRAYYISVSPFSMLSLATLMSPSVRPFGPHSP